MKTIEFKKNMAVIQPMLEEALNEKNDEVTVGKLRINREIVENMLKEFNNALEKIDKNQEATVNPEIIPLKLVCGNINFRRLYASLN